MKSPAVREFLYNYLRSQVYLREEVLLTLSMQECRTDYGRTNNPVAAFSEAQRRQALARVAQTITLVEELALQMPPPRFFCQGRGFDSI
jgi:hypothetical protein